MDEKKNEPTFLTQADTEKAGHPCSDSAGASAPDFAPVKDVVVNV